MRVADLETEQKLVRLFVGDWDRLPEIYPAMEPSEAVRHIVHAHIKKQHSRIRASLPELETQNKEINFD